MYLLFTGVECSDEISTGLDAATTYDICKILGETTRTRRSLRIVSLLQPPPETVALFDEIILLGEGRVLYAGPVGEVTQWFKSLGYVQPERMDPADWLQSLPTKDGAKYLANPEEMTHLTNEEFAQKFIESEHGEEILRKLQQPPKGISLKDKPGMNQKYANSALRNLNLVIRRELVIWWRDRTKRIARTIQCFMMGVIVGTVFWQSDDPQTRMGVNFQSIFFISLGAMLKVPVSCRLFHRIHFAFEMSSPPNSYLYLILAATNRHSCSVLQRTRCTFLSYLDVRFGKSLGNSAIISPRRADLWEHCLLVQWIRPPGCKLRCLPPFAASMCVHMQRYVFRLFCQG